ncbi:MAG: solute carrier family 23 protein [Bacillota bacterium]
MWFRGPAFSLFHPLAIQAGQIGGWPLVLGMALATSPVEMILSRFMDQARKIFAPVVIGSFLTCSGLILMGAGMASLCGGQGVEDFGHPRYIALGLFVLALIVLFNRFGKGLVQTASIAIAIAAGYLVSIPMGLVDFSAISEAGWFMAPIPFKFGLSFTWTLLIPWIIAYILSGLECIGDLTGVAQSSGEPITGDIHKKRLEGGMMGDAVGSAIAAIFGTLPNITFTQNIGVIQLTKVGARVVGYSCGIILMILGLLPKIGALISIMPQPVLGGATIPMFGLVAVAGIRIVLSSGFTERNAFIFAISVAMGMGVNYYPEAVSMLPEWLEVIFAQPLATTAVFATALHLITPDQAAVQAKTAEVEA